MEVVCWDSSAVRGMVNSTSPSSSSSAANIPYPATVPSLLSRTWGQRERSGAERKDQGGPKARPGRPAMPHLGVQLHPGLPAPCQEPGEGVDTILPLGAALDRRLWIETGVEGEGAMMPIADPFSAAAPRAGVSPGPREPPVFPVP